MVRSLKELGYKVTSFASAEQALLDAGVLRQCALLLSDVRLPGASGIDLARQAGAQNASLRVLLMSGYVEEAEHAALISEGRYQFLHKPFNSEGLARRVRSVLDSPAPARGSDVAG